MLQAYLFAFATVLTTMGGGLLSIKYRERLHLLLSFTAGVVISVALLEILPEMFSTVQEHGLSLRVASIFLLVGFFAVHVIEKLIVLHQGHEHEYADHRHPFVGYVGALGLVLHSFLDGFGIALAFQVNSTTGIIVAVAVLLHDFSDGINTASIMLLNKHTVRKAFWLLLADALAPLVGVFATRYIAVTPFLLTTYLAMFGGFLLYIGAADLLPEAHGKGSSYKVILLMLTGVLFTIFFTAFI